MKINELIRMYRKEQHLTQEQVANYLGVTAPAVNKWENGVSYPDITLLAPLARFLKTDIDTLLPQNNENPYPSMKEYPKREMIFIVSPFWGILYEERKGIVSEMKLNEI